MAVLPHFSQVFEGQNLRNLGIAIQILDIPSFDSSKASVPQQMTRPHLIKKWAYWILSYSS